MAVIKWQLQDAKNQLSKVIDNAIKRGPQIVTRHGKEAVVVVSIEEYRKLKKPTENIVNFFGNSPLCGLDLDLERQDDGAREVEL